MRRMRRMRRTRMRTRRRKNKRRRRRRRDTKTRKRKVRYPRKTVKERVQSLLKLIKKSRETMSKRRIVFTQLRPRDQNSREAKRKTQSLRMIQRWPYTEKRLTTDLWNLH